MSLDAMKQALEALEDVIKEQGYARGTTMFAITVLRAAIKQAQEPRQWRGLTEDEIALICGECAASHADDIRYARAIEAKLKAKNA